MLVAALLLGNQDVDVSVMGPGVPMTDLALVCERMQPQALVVFSNQPPGEEFPRQLARLALGLGVRCYWPETVPIWRRRAWPARPSRAWVTKGV